MNEFEIITHSKHKKVEFYQIAARIVRKMKFVHLLAIEFSQLYEPFLGDCYLL